MINVLRQYLFVFALFCFISRVWADQASLVGKCDPKKIDTITVTENEYNPKATKPTDYIVHDTLQGGNGGKDAVNTEKYFLDDHGNINQFFENGKQADPHMAVDAAFVVGGAECIGVKAFLYGALKRGSPFLASMYPGANLQGNWFQQKSFMMGRGAPMWSRYLEKDENGKKYLIVESRAFGTLASVSKPNEVHILYDELDLNDGVVTKEISVYYDNPSGLNLTLDNIDTKKTIEEWTVEHTDSVYFDEKDYTYGFRG